MTITERQNVKIPFPIKKANTFSTRLKGLMFQKKPLDQEGLWIAPCNSIHMCFMYFSIDAVFLDKQHKIVHLVSDLKPWRFVTPVQNAHSVLELPTGNINKLNLTIGQVINLEE